MKCVDTRAYRHKITVEQLTGSAGADGLVDESVSANWTTYVVRRAEIKSQKGREFFKAQQVHASMTHLFEILSCNLCRVITPKMRIKFDSRTFNIQSSHDVDEARTVVHIVATEVK